MARTQTMVQLTEELIRELDEEAARQRVSRSALIRGAIDQMLAARREDAITAAIVDGYRRIPQAEPDEWGDLTALTDRSVVETLRRLDQEEREAGLPWK